MSVLPLYVKHLVATSSLAAPSEWLRSLAVACRTYLRNPELTLLRSEPRIMSEALGGLIKNGTRCLDIGAHIGSVSYQLGLLARPGNVRMIEAVPEKAKWLKRRFGDGQVTSCAVGETEGEVTFYVDPARPGFSSLSKTSGRRQRAISVHCKPLDQIFPNDDFDFIKIDVEGHELEALRSGERLLKRSRPIILFEAGARPADGPSRSDDLFVWLTTEMNYRIHAVFEYGHRGDPLTLDEFKRYRTYPFLAFNYFAVPLEEDTLE